MLVATLLALAAAALHARYIEALRALGKKKLALAAYRESLAALEVARASGLEIEFQFGRLPVLPGALDYGLRGFCSGGLHSNREFAGEFTAIDDAVPEAYRNLVFDPQTSGGLLIFCPELQAAQLATSLASAHLYATPIGSAKSSPHPFVKIGGQTPNSS